ncbi:hypothetical protein LTR08_007830 [Meristemomyces frigidus]|nr:hypothetical protein LTR08_007830 [Meristemomyces frigidus]
MSQQRQPERMASDNQNPMASSAKSKAAKIALARQQPLSCTAKLKPALQNLARAISHSERADKYKDAGTLQKQFQAIVPCDKTEARQSVEACKHSMPPHERNNVEAFLAEKEFTYAILRMEAAVQDEPSGSPSQKHLSALKSLRRSYAQREHKAVDAHRGWLQMN